MIDLEVGELAVARQHLREELVQVGNGPSVPAKAEEFTAQRRLGRLVEFGLLRGFWSAGAMRPRGRYAYVFPRAARVDIERLAWPEGRPDRPPDRSDPRPGSCP